MLKRRLSLFLVVALLVGMMALTAHAAKYTLAFEFVTDSDATGFVSKTGRSQPDVWVDTKSGSLNSVYLWVTNNRGGEVGTTISRVGHYKMDEIGAGECMLHGQALSGYGYITGTWTP